MLRASLILLLAVPASVAGGQSIPQSPRPVTEWYGAAIGQQVPPHAGSTEEALWPDLLKLPAPWTEVSVETDAQGRVAQLHFWDALPAIPDAPRKYRPDMTDQIPQYFNEGATIGAELLTRFGKPTTSTTEPYQGGRKWATLGWDFVPRFVRCDGTTPVFASAAHEPSGMLGAIELRYDPTGVELDIRGMTSREGTMSGPPAEEEQATGLARCEAKPAEPDPTQALNKGIDDFCRDNADKCITSIPGVTIIPVPGTTVVEVPCPPGSHHLACYKGKAISPPRPGAPSD